MQVAPRSGFSLPRLPAVLAVAILLLLAVLVAGCAQPAKQPAAPVASAAVPPGFPLAFYRDASAQGRPVYRIDSAGSKLTITVRRGGSLARLGHDHVVASHSVQGYAAPQDGRADLWLPLAELSVDEPALRAEQGFDSQPSASDIAGTRSNMLDRVLEVQRYPVVLIHAVRAGDGAQPAHLTVSITLHGRTRDFDVPVKMQDDGNLLQASGSLAFNQSDFGITPLSILGGAIEVQDLLLLRFEIHAWRLGASDAVSG